MTKYILNNTPVMTTNNFGINNISLDLDISNNYSFNDFEITNNDLKIIKTIEKNFNSKIGLSFDKSYKLKIYIEKIIEKPIIFTYNFKKNNTLIDEVEINVDENSKVNLIFKYIGSDDTKCFHHLKQVINLKNNSNCNVSIINLINDSSDSFLSFENNLESNSSLTHNIIDLGGKIKISNYYSKLNDNSNNNLNNIYFGTDNDIIDMNYYMDIIGKNANCNINSQGALNKKAIKNFKGTIDFKKGSSKSNGNELENVILLSKEAKSKSLPMLLCSEEDVIGSHGVSSGKIDDEKLFYLMTRGLSKKEAEKLIVNSNFDKIINEIKDKKIKEEILKEIDKKIL